MRTSLIRVAVVATLLAGPVSVANAQELGERIEEIVEMVEPDIDTDPDGYKDVAEALVNGTADKVEDVVYPHVPLHPVGTFTVGCAAIPTFNPIDIIVAPGAHTHYHSFWGSEIAATGRDHGFLLTSDHKNSPGR